MIERTHRVLKSSLKAQPSHRNWLDHLPWVLLALRASPKKDHGSSSAQLTLGTTLRLPGQFFSLPDPDTPANQTKYARNLESTLSSIRAPLPAWHSNPRVYVDPFLQSANCCFVRNDRKKGSFELPYKGPYKVLSQNEKFFTLDLRDEVDNISIDCLKAACMLENLCANDNENEVSSNLDTVPTSVVNEHFGISPSIFRRQKNMRDDFDITDPLKPTFDERQREITRNRYGRVICRSAKHSGFV